MSMDIAEPEHAAAPLSAADLERLVRIHSRRLRNFIRRRVGNAADVEDLMQDTYLEALRCLDRYAGASRPETWLFGIALNLVRNHYKRASQRPLLDNEMAGDENESRTAQDPMDTVARLEEIRRLSHAMQQLPLPSMAVLMLVLDEHLTYEQAAARLQIPIGTVRSRLARARAMLKTPEKTTSGEQS